MAPDPVSPVNMQNKFNLNLPCYIINDSGDYTLYPGLLQTSAALYGFQLILPWSDIPETG